MLGKQGALCKESWEQEKAEWTLEQLLKFSELKEKSGQSNQNSRKAKVVTQPVTMPRKQ